ncbi:Uncharacterized protein C1orf87 homolog [Apodemus speciosus]|uniref:Uncharacterized protein C1orf87 homolog n=1 Tax=Apodemus speciosus TaxID=105296 RepID=A0ABQ0EP20_APOSI
MRSYKIWRGIMSSPWKTSQSSAPMPEMIVKIIGSKHFRYFVEKPMIKQNEKTEPQPSLQKSGTENSRQVSRDLTGPTDSSEQQITANLAEKEESKQKFLTRVLSNRFLDGRISHEATVHCRSAPTGDQSLSYIHSLPRKKSIDWCLEHTAKDSSGQAKETKSKPTMEMDCEEEVNCGELLCFLKEATKDNLQQHGTAAYSNPRKPPGPSYHKQSIPPQDSGLLSEVNKSLLEILKMALRTCQGKFNIDCLNLSFRKEDRSFSGCLPLPKGSEQNGKCAQETVMVSCGTNEQSMVMSICSKHGLYVTLTLLETLLHHQELGYRGEINGKNKKETREDSVDVPERPQRKTEHVKTPEENMQPKNPTTMTSAPEDTVTSFKNRPVSQPVEHLARMKDKQPELWIDRFRKLENALYLCDMNNTGVLEQERARRLIHNYNLIYNLSLSPRKINQALQRYRSGENIILEPALQYLKEL